LYREILSNTKYTDAVGNELELPNEVLWGIRTKLDKCLEWGQCEGLTEDCKFEAKSKHGTKEMKYCEIRRNGDSVNIPCG